MEKFFTDYWPVAVFMAGMVSYMAKLYIDNMMMKFSKMTADEMSKEIKDLFLMTDKGFKDYEQKLKELRNDFNTEMKGIRSEVRYIKDNYQKEGK
jgi:hypothetical protein